MRRRLLLTTDAVGGVWTYSLDLARALADLDDVVVFLAVLGPRPTVSQLDEAAAVPGLQLIATGLPLDWTAKDEPAVREAAWLLAALASEVGADSVQLHTPALAICPYPCPVVSVVHSCVATWWASVRHGSLPTDLAWRAGLAREGLRRSDRVIAPTRAFAAEVQRTYGLRSAPEAVHNGRALDSPTSEPVDAALTAGRLWDEGKNVAAFDRAAALSHVPFLAAGPLAGPEGGAVTLSAAEAMGKLSSETLRELLGRRPVFVSAAIYEPFGLSVLEAARAGCALVLADRPGFRELWREAALFVDAHDAPAIAAAVERLIALPALRDELGGAAMARASDFTAERMGSAMLAIHRDLAAVAERVAA